MIVSMTGFAKAAVVVEGLSVSVEMRSVNHRNLEISLRLPRSHSALELSLKNLVRRALNRGRVDINIEMARQDGGDVFEVDMDLARAYHQTLVGLQGDLGLAEGPRLEYFLRVEGLVKHTAAEHDPEQDLPAMELALGKAVDILIQMRRREGLVLAADLADRLGVLRKLLESIQAHANTVPARARERLFNRMAALLGEDLEPDPARLAQEAAFIADKADITEEIVRAGSHIDQFFKYMDSSRPCGRSLNFLAQELLREFSTMGSKSSCAELSHLVVEAKTEVEKIREQVQNVE